MSQYKIGVNMSKEIEPLEIVRLYRVWTSIMYRCYRPKYRHYKNYGGRGIDVCAEWHDFNQFCYDVGKRINDTDHLDRRDNDKGYSRENCRWISPKINHRNKRNNKYYETHVGKICESELIENVGYTRTQFRRAINRFGIEKFIELYRTNSLPGKRIYSPMVDIINKKFGSITVLELDEDKSTGARYFCICDCGNKTRISRHKLINGKVTYCKGCSKRGAKNPNTKAKRDSRTP